MQVKIRSCQVIRLILSGFVVRQEIIKPEILRVQTELANTKPVSMRISKLQTTSLVHSFIKVRSSLILKEKLISDFVSLGVPPGGGGTLILDLIGCTVQQCVFL